MGDVIQVGKSFFKGPRITEKVRRRRKREARNARESQNKQTVRKEDKVCRFDPRCCCRRGRGFRGFGHTEVAHLEHKGMGSNPKEDRSTVEKLILLCEMRHKGNPFALDRKTIKCKPLGPMGTRGLVSWWVNVDELIRQSGDYFIDVLSKFPGAEWIELSRETESGFEELQPGILLWLREGHF